jgi:hypothetical protein
VLSRRIGPIQGFDPENPRPQLPNPSKSFGFQRLDDDLSVILLADISQLIHHKDFQWVKIRFQYQVRV